MMGKSIHQIIASCLINQPIANHDFWCFLCGGTLRTSSTLTLRDKHVCLWFKNKPYISKSLKTHHSKPRSRPIGSREAFSEYQIYILRTKYGISRSLRIVANHWHTIRSQKTNKFDSDGLGKFKPYETASLAYLTHIAGRFTNNST
jgi:hypothetical protein